MKTTYPLKRHAWNSLQNGHRFSRFRFQVQVASRLVAVLWLLLGSAAANRAAAGDLATYGVVKGQDWLYIEAGGVSLLTVRSGDLKAWALASGPGLLQDASVQVPSGQIWALNPTGLLASVTRQVSNTNTFEQTYPAGTYIVSAHTANQGSNGVTFQLPAATYPTVPAVLNAAALMTLDARYDQTVTWRSVAAPDTPSTIQVRVTDIQGTELFSTPGPGLPGALLGTATSAVIPASAWRDAWQLPVAYFNIEVTFFRFAEVDTTSWPGASGFGGFYRTVTLMVSPNLPPPQGPVLSFGLALGTACQQTNAGACYPLANNNCSAVAWTVPGSANVLAYVDLARPDTTLADLSLQLDGTNFVFVESFPTLSALNVAYGSGPVAFRFWQPDLPVLEVSLTVPAGSFPAPPVLANFNAAQAIDPDTDFTLQWAKLSSNPSSGAFQFTLFDGQGNVVFDSGAPGVTNALPADATSVTLPAQLLAPQAGYAARLRFFQWSTQNTNLLAGAKALGGRFTEVRFPLTAAGAWPPIYAVGFTILGARDPVVVAVGDEVFLPLAALAGERPYTWSTTTGQLPAGVVLDPLSGQVSGWPRAPGTNVAHVQVADAVQQTAEADLTMVVTGAVAAVQMLPAILDSAAVDAFYLAELDATNGVPPYTWHLKNGSALPAGLQLDAGLGMITGFPGQSGLFAFDVEVVDALNQRDRQTLVLTIAAAPPTAAGRLDDFQVLPNGTAQVVVNADPDLESILEVSSNLLTWTALVTNQASPDPIVLPDSPGGKARFYRFRTGNEVTPANPLNLVPALDPRFSVAALLGTNGGTLALTNPLGVIFTLNLPTNALDNYTKIRMTCIAGYAGLPVDSSVIGAVDLAPAGTLLATPATLTVETPTALDTNAVAFGTDGSGGDFHLMPFTKAHNQATIPIAGFSGKGIGKTRSAGKQGNRPCSTGAEFLDKLADYGAKRNWQMSAKEIEAFFRQWLYAVQRRWLWPAQKDDHFLYDANTELLIWWSTVLGNSVYPFVAPEIALARQDMKQAVDSAFKQARYRCLQKYSVTDGLLAEQYMIMGAKAWSAGYCDVIDVVQMEKQLKQCLRMQFSFAGHGTTLTPHNDHQDFTYASITISPERNRAKPVLYRVIERHRWEESDEEGGWVYAAPEKIFAGPDVQYQVNERPDRYTHLEWADLRDAANVVLKSQSVGCNRMELQIDLGEMELVIVPAGGFDTIIKGTDFYDYWWVDPWINLFPTESMHIETGTQGGHEGWAFSTSDTRSMEPFWVQIPQTRVNARFTCQFTLDLIHRPKK